LVNSNNILGCQSNKLQRHKFSKFYNISAKSWHPSSCGHIKHLNLLSVFYHFLLSSLSLW
jgi:hypothetical protein